MALTVKTRCRASLQPLSSPFHLLDFGGEHSRKNSRAYPGELHCCLQETPHFSRAHILT